MYIRCPKCGRRGHLPDRLVPEAHTLRCRKCQAQFKTPELTGVATDRGNGPRFDPMTGLDRSEPASPYMTDGFFSAFDDSLVSARKPGPGDSNYELTFTLGDAEGDSGADWDAEADVFEPESPSSDEIPVHSPPAVATSPEPWHHRFIVSWGPRLIMAALAMIGVSVPVIAYMLWKMLGTAEPLDRPAPALIAGFACSIALMMVSVPLILLAAFMAELVHEVRRFCQRAERPASIGPR